MWNWLKKMFRLAPAPAPIRPGDPVPPGLRVSMPGIPAVGTVSAFVEGPRGPRARVVFQGPRRTWIEHVSLHELEL